MRALSKISVRSLTDNLTKIGGKNFILLRLRRNGRREISRDEDFRDKLIRKSRNVTESDGWREY